MDIVHCNNLFVNLAFADDNEYASVHDASVNLVEDGSSQPILSKPIEPKRYNGRSLNASEWLDIFEVAAIANNWTAEVKLKKVGSYLEDDALKWYLNRIVRKQETLTNGNRRSTIATLRQALEGADDESRWSKFTQLMKSAFPGGRTREGRWELLHARTQQVGEDFQTYANDKLSLCHNYDENMTEEEKVACLMRGMLPSLYEKLLPLEIKKLDDLENKAMLFSEASRLANNRSFVNNLSMALGRQDACYANLAERRFNGFESRPKTESQSGQRRSSFRRSDNRQSGNRNQNRQTLAKSPVRGSVTCYGCGRKGHVIANCRSTQRFSGDSSNRRVRFSVPGNGNRATM